MRTSRPAIAVACAVMLSAAASLASTVDVPLTYVRHPEEQHGFWPSGSARIEVSTSPPQGQWTLPEVLGKLPLYASVEMGSAERLMIFCRRQADDPFYNRIYFDQNGNGNLQDDAPIDGEYGSESPPRYTTWFQPIDTAITLDGHEAPYRIRLRLTIWDIETLAHVPQVDVQDLVHCRSYVHCHYAGAFVLGGEQFYLALADTNGNGRFGDRLTMTESDDTYGTASLRMRGDYMLIMREPAPAPRGALPCTNRLWLKGQTYDVAIDIPERHLRLIPTPGEQAPLRPAQTVNRLVLYAEDASGGETTQRSLALFEPAAEVRVPMDQYRLAYYELLRQTPKQEWSLNGFASNTSRKQVVAPGPDAVITFGEPFTCAVEVPKACLDGRIKPPRLNFLLEGAGGELVKTLTCLSGEDDPAIPMSTSRKRSPKEPRYKIVTKDGETVTQGTFEYG